MSGFRIALCLAALFAALPTWGLQPPTGKVILTVAGKISEKNTANGAAFDMAMLESLPQKSFTTRTPWDRQPVKFSGPLLRDVLAAVKASGVTLKALAVNDYATTLPVSDTQLFEVLLATKMNGQAIPLRTKGPLFIVYPFDSDPALKAKVYQERAAWQLKSLQVE